MAKNPSEIVKIYILRFVKRFYDNPQLQYADQIIKQWVDSFVRILVEIILNGFVGYLAIFALTFIFPVLRTKIFLGDAFWHFPFVVILIGIVLWFVRETYKWFQSNKKTVKLGGIR